MKASTLIARVESALKNHGSFWTEQDILFALQTAIADFNDVRPIRSSSTFVVTESTTTYNLPAGTFAVVGLSRRDTSTVPYRRLDFSDPRFDKSVGYDLTGMDDATGTPQIVFPQDLADTFTTGEEFAITVLISHTIPTTPDDVLTVQDRHHSVLRAGALYYCFEGLWSNRGQLLNPEQTEFFARMLKNAKETYQDLQSQHAARRPAVVSVFDHVDSHKGYIY